MARLFNIARMTTATIGTGTITLGSAVSGFLTFDESGVASGNNVSYAIEDGANREVGIGAYTSAGTTLTRTVTNSTNSNLAISLSGNAEVFITAIAKDLQPVRFMCFSLVDKATAVAVATSIGGDWTIPFRGTILQSDTKHDVLAATTDTAGTTGTMVVDIHLNGTTIMTTNKLDIETTEKGTQTAATQPDLTTTSFVDGDILTFDIDAIHTTPALGLKVLMAFRTFRQDQF